MVELNKINISLWVAAILVEILIALIVGVLIIGTMASIVAIIRARVETIPMTGIPSIDSGVYPDPHVEWVYPSNPPEKAELFEGVTQDEYEKRRNTEMNTKFEEWELPCVNEKCQYNDHTFDQNCAAMVGERELPYLPYCQKYIAEGTNCAEASEMKKVYCIRCCFRDKHGDLESVTKLNFGLFEDKKVAQVVVDALNRPLKDSWELKRKSESENIELKHEQWSPDNAEVFYELNSLSIGFDYDEANCLKG